MGLLGLVFDLELLPAAFCTIAGHGISRKNHDWRWNLLDSIIVLASLVDVALVSWTRLKSFGLSEGKGALELKHLL